MSENNEDQFSQIRGALGSIGLSATLVLIGSILSQGLGFGTRIILTRFLPVDGYGDIVLGITVLNILGLFSIIGLKSAQVRYLPQADDKKEQTKVAAAVFQIGVILSLFWAFIGVIFAGFIAGTIFESPKMTNVVRIFALSLPFYVLYKLSIKGIQGHKETAPWIVTTKFVHPLARFGGVTVIALAGFGAVGLSIGYNFAFIFAGLVGFSFFVRGGEYRIRQLLTPVKSGRYWELLKFSLPLALSGSFGLVTSNTDRILLGILGTNTAVGIYDVAILLAKFILFFGPILDYLTQPIMSEYDAERNVQQMDQLYTIITRWLVILTFPIFTLLVLFPEPLLGTFFGNEYRAGGLVLSVLAIGYFAARFVGLSGSFLVATGDTNIIMYISGVTALLNLLLNILLIPSYGIMGAAIATVGSTLLNNALQAAYVYKSTGIHPFTRELLMPISLVLVCLIIASALFSTNSLNVIEAVLFTGLVSSLLLICILITRSVYVIELKLINSLFEEIGINLDLQRRLEAVTTD